MDVRRVSTGVTVTHSIQSLKQLATIKKAFSIVRGEAILCPRCAGQGWENTCFNPDEDPGLTSRCKQCRGSMVVVVQATPEHHAIVELCEAAGLTVAHTCPALSVWQARCTMDAGHEGHNHIDVINTHFRAVLS